MLYRKILFGFLVLIVAGVCSIGTSYFFQQKVDAQCVPIPSNLVKIKYWRDSGNGTQLGHWDFCALTQVEGIDDRSGEGVGVNAFPDSPSGQTKTFTDNKPSWSIWRGGDVDHYEVICICLFDGTCG